MRHTLTGISELSRLFPQGTLERGVYRSSTINSDDRLYLFRCVLLPRRAHHLYSNKTTDRFTLSGFVKTKPVPWTRPVSKKGTTAAAADVEIARNSAIRSGELAFLTRLTVRCDCSPWIFGAMDRATRCRHHHAHRDPRHQQGSTSQRIRKSKANRQHLTKGILKHMYTDVGADDSRKYP